MRAVACCFAALVVFGIGYAAAPPRRAAEVQRPIDFVKDVQPLLTAYCVQCHGEKKQKGRLRLDSRDHPLREGAGLPGKGEQSPLIHRVSGTGDGERMPPKGPYLTAKQIGILRAWIDQGAVWPVSAATAKGAHWAYRPLARPQLPA